MSNQDIQLQPCIRPWTAPKPKALLEESATRVELRITDISEKFHVSHSYTKPDEATLALRHQPSSGVRIRIISVLSDRTIAPLSITASLLELLFEQYMVNPEFADVVSSFGEEPNIAEGRSSNTTIDLDDSGYGEVSYQVRYIEENRRGGQNPWSLRHTGVFHRLKANNGTDIVVVLHPVRRPAFEAIIAALQSDHEKRSRLCADPFLLHQTLFGCYFGHWRWYLRYLGERFGEENNLAMVTKPEKTKPDSSFHCVRELRNTNDLVLFARACCAGNRDLLDNLIGSCGNSSQSQKALCAHQSKMSGYIESADVLQGRIQNLIDLVGYTLTLHNQLESAKVEKELQNLTADLKKLTQDTVDDSATVKIITFVSAVYLPGSFIATLLGMNLFVFEEETKRLKISPDFWIFIAAWLPLTIITGGIYVFIKSKSKQEAMNRRTQDPKHLILPA